MLPLVLASTSPYRRELLERLKISFEVTSPEVDETSLDQESPEQTATRLAEAKAKAVATLYPAALIIGSDQVAVLEGMPLGKPHTHDNAFKQLTMMSGKKVVFNTALCLYNSKTGTVQNRLVPFTVYFRELPRSQIEAYLQKEQPYNCAGSAKSEGLGIALIAKMEGDDPNALIGLPLIALIDMLKNEGVKIF
jgi:septum formation protein